MPDRPSDDRSPIAVRCSRLAVRCSPLAVLGSLVASGASPLAAQHYTETLRTSVTARSGLEESGRFVVRDVVYRRTMRADTMVMQAESVRLEETRGERTVRHDTDGVVGGWWKLVPGPLAGWRVVARPFVPDVLLDVSDLGAAMDDFFPVPPALAPGSRHADAEGRAWQRLADSAGHARYRWTHERTRTETRLVADSVPLQLRETSRESGSGTWDAVGALAWQRRIDTESRSTVRGATVLATVEQRIGVQRHD